MTAGFDWSAAETALETWISTSLGALPVLWSYKARQRPSTFPAVVMHRASAMPIGLEETITAESPEEDPEFDHELTVTTSQRWDLTLQVAVLGDHEKATGSDSPDALLVRALTHLRRDEVGAALKDAGLGLLGFGTVTADPPEIGGSSWRPAASVEVRFNLVESVETPLGYIATVELENQSNSETTTITLPEDA